MSRCPNVQRCSECSRLLIHKGSRSAHESASYLGQIVHNLMPQVFTWNDIDGAMYRRSIRLLRLFEHKSPGQHRKGAQQELLELMSRIVEHVKSCPTARQDFGLHQQSGVYLIEGDPHEGNQLGPSKVTRFHDGAVKEFEDEEELLCWLALLGEVKHRQYVRDKLSRRRCVRVET